MIPSLGLFTLLFSVLVAFFQSFFIFTRKKPNKKDSIIIRKLSFILFALLSFSFAALIFAYVTSDFSVLNVVQNSHTLKPMIYKISGVWGNHEGSMLLWVWIISLWGLAVALSSKIPHLMQARILTIQGMISLGFILFIVLTSNPFIRIYPAPLEGMGLNPVLQDLGLAIHPPLLYMGYVGFSIAFCFAIAGMMDKKIDAKWAKLIRPWVLAAWSALTIGIIAGATWAYYELGWGGFWFWDPVENASLMPWLAGTALLHSVAVLERRGQLGNWTIFLAILAFSFSLLGTFLVRSGILTSVHAFASDPTRGVFILILLSIAIGGALLFYAVQAPKVKSKANFKPVSRETIMLLNNVFLFTFCITVLLGTTYPIILNALNLGSISVGAPYYTAVLLPLLFPFTILMGAAPHIAWKKGKIKNLYIPFIVTLLLLFLISILPIKHKLLSLLGFSAGGWVIFSTLYNLWKKRDSKLQLSYYGMILAHIGFGVFILGVTATTLWKSEKILWMTPGDSVEIAGKKIDFIDTRTSIVDNYMVTFARFNIDGKIAIPEKRLYPVEKKMTSEVSLKTNGFDVIYMVLGDEDKDNLDRWVVRLYYHPLALFILFGAMMIALGGVTSLMDKKRYE